MTNELKKRDCDIRMKLVPYGAGWTDVYLDIGEDNLYFIISSALGNTFTDLLGVLYYLHPDNNDPENELTEDSSITLSEWLGRWLEEYKKPTLRPSTFAGYSKDIANHILPYLGSKKLTQLKTADIQKQYNRLLESGAVTKKTTPTMSFGEWMDFWYQTYCKNTLKESTQATYEQRIYKQIRYVKGKLVIAPPKTKASERTIILPPPVLEMLAEYRKALDSIWMFPSPVKKEDVPRDPSACRKALARILERAECEIKLEALIKEMKAEFGIR